MSGFFPEMNSVREARENCILLDQARAAAAQSRQNYIDGISCHVGEDELHHRHLDAMHAESLSAKASSRYLGQRTVNMEAFN